MFQKQVMFGDQIQATMMESFRIFASILFPFEIFSQLTSSDLLEIDFSTDIKDIPQFIKSDEELEQYIQDNHPSIQALLVKVSDNDKAELLRQTKLLLLKVLGQMQERLPFNDPVFATMRLIFINEDYKFFDKEWRTLAKEFPNIIPKDAEEQFNFDLRRFGLNVGEIKKQCRGLYGSPLQMWNMLKSTYPFMGKLAMALLSVGFSSVPVERLFSKLKDFKPGKKNRLKVEHVEACLLVEQEAKGDFEATEDMLYRRKSMWKDPKKAQAEFQGKDKDEESSDESVDFEMSMINDGISSLNLEDDMMVQSDLTDNDNDDDDDDDNDDYDGNNDNNNNEEHESKKSKDSNEEEEDDDRENHDKNDEESRNNVEEIKHNNEEEGKDDSESEEAKMDSRDKDDESDHQSGMDEEDETDTYDPEEFPDKKEIVSRYPLRRRSVPFNDVGRRNFKLSQPPSAKNGGSNKRSWEHLNFIQVYIKQN